MGLITAKELAKAAHLDRFGVVGTFAGWGLLHLLRLAPLNRVFRGLAPRVQGTL